MNVEVEIVICCPHCEWEDTYYIAASACISNTSESWNVLDGISDIICMGCEKMFQTTAHLNTTVKKV